MLDAGHALDPPCQTLERGQSLGGEKVLGDPGDEQEIVARVSIANGLEPREFDALLRQQGTHGRIDFECELETRPFEQGNERRQGQTEHDGDDASRACDQHVEHPRNHDLEHLR